MDVALPTGEMEREVQSELEWFTEDEACSESALFRVIPEKKEDQAPVRSPLAQPSLFGPFRPGERGGERRVERLAPRKINSSLKEPFQTERYAGRLALRH